MRCAHCKTEIDPKAYSARLDAGVRLTDGTIVARDVNLHLDCEGSWWLAHHPALMGKVRVHAA